MSTPALRQHERLTLGRAFGSGGEPHASRREPLGGAVQLCPKAPSALPAQSQDALCWSRFGGQNTNGVRREVNNHEATRYEGRGGSDPHLRSARRGSGGGVCRNVGSFDDDKFDPYYQSVGHRPPLPEHVASEPSI